MNFFSGLTKDNSWRFTSLPSTVLIIIFLISGAITAAVYDDFRCNLIFSYPTDCGNFLRLLSGNCFSCGIFIFFAFLLGASAFGFFAVPIVVFILGYSLCCSFLVPLNIYGMIAVAVYAAPWALFTSLIVTYFSLCFLSSRRLFAVCGQTGFSEEVSPLKNVSLLCVVLAVLIPLIFFASALEYFLFMLII